MLAADRQIGDLVVWTQLAALGGARATGAVVEVVRHELPLLDFCPARFEAADFSRPWSTRIVGFEAACLGDFKKLVAGADVIFDDVGEFEGQRIAYESIDFEYDDAAALHELQEGERSLQDHRWARPVLVNLMWTQVAANPAPSTEREGLILHQVGPERLNAVVQSSGIDLSLSPIL